jgi:hypothetical protein
MGQLNVRLSDRAEARLSRLCDLLNLNKKDAIERSIAHLLGTLEEGGKAYLIPPSELPPGGHADEGPEG